MPMIALGLDCIHFLIGYGLLKKLLEDNGKVDPTTDGPRVAEGSQFPSCLGQQLMLETIKEKSVAYGWRR